MFKKQYICRENLLHSRGKQPTIKHQLELINLIKNESRSLDQKKNKKIVEKYENVYDVDLSLCCVALFRLLILLFALCGGFNHCSLQVIVFSVCFTNINNNKLLYNYIIFIYIIFLSSTIQKKKNPHILSHFQVNFFYYYFQL